MDDHLFDADFLAQLEQLRLRFRTRANGKSGDGRRSRRQGVSAEFSDFREYQPGDDFRRVDWNAYARFERLTLKLFMEERQMQVWLLVDLSASMQLEHKALMAKRLALTMGYLALAGYDQVSIVPLVDSPTPALGPLTGKNAFLKMADYLAALPAGGESPLSKRITALDLPSGPGVCYLFTDGFSQDGLDDALTYLKYKKKDVLLVHLLGRGELSPPHEGAVRLVDSETGQQRDIEINAALLRTYADALQDFCASLRERCYRHGFRYELVPADMDLRRAVLTQLLEAGL